MLRRIFSPAFIGFFTRKTILLVVAFFVFAVPFLSENNGSITSDPNITKVEGQIWTRTRQMTSEQNAAAHFKKHGKDFGFQKQDEYITATHNFIKNPPIGTLTIVQPDGDTVLYNPDKNWFAVKTKNNVPRTMFKPNPDIHGYRTNMEYFQAQMINSKDQTEKPNE